MTFFENVHALIEVFEVFSPKSVNNCQFGFDLVLFGIFRISVSSKSKLRIFYWKCPCLESIFCFSTQIILCGYLSVVFLSLFDVYWCILIFNYDRLLECPCLERISCVSIQKVFENCQTPMTRFHNIAIAFICPWPLTISTKLFSLFLYQNFNDLHKKMLLAQRKKI